MAATRPESPLNACGRDFGLWLDGAPAQIPLPPDADEQFQQGFEEASAMQKIPAQWAYDVATERLNAVDPRVAAGSEHTALAAWIITAFARLIEQHEEPPQEDPLVDEIEAIVLAYAACTDGMTDLRAAVREGMERGVQIGHERERLIRGEVGDTIKFMRPPPFMEVDVNAVGSGGVPGDEAARLWAMQPTDSVLELLVRTAFPATDVRLIDGKVKALRDALDRHGLDVAPAHD